jgi:spermidine synthase
MNIFYRILILIFLNGFTAIVAQIILYKEILSQIYANEIVLSFVLSSWLLSGAIAGIIIFPNYFKEKNEKFLMIGYGLLPVISILISIFSLLVIRNIKALFNIPVEQIINIWDAVIITFLIYSPAAFFLTLSFSFAGEILKRKNGDIKLLYIVEVIGSIVAGVLFTLFLTGKYSNLELLYWLGVITIIAVYVLYRDKNDYSKIINSIMVIVLVLYLIPLLTNFLKKIDDKSFNKSYSKYNIISKKEGLDSKVVIAKKDDEYFIFSNGLLKYQTKNPDIMQFIGWPMVLRNSYKNILLVNGGYTGVISEIQKYKTIEKITSVETDIDTAELLEKNFKHTISSDNIKFVHGDLIYYLYNINEQEKYDLVLLNLFEPNTFLNNRYFTFEFFKLLKRHISKDGLIVFYLSSSENYLIKELSDLLSVIYGTVKSVFLNVEVIYGDTTYFLVSDGNINLKTKEIVNNIKKNNYQIPQLNPVNIEEKIKKSVEIKDLLKERKIKINKMLEPEAYFRMIKKDLYLFKNSQTFIKVIAVFILFLLVIYNLFKTNKIINNFSPYISIFLLSLTTIILELSLILIYQSFYGYLYRSIGLLYSFFMVGIVIGAILHMIFEIKYKSLIILAELLNLLILFYILNVNNIEKPINPNFIIFFIIGAGFFVGAMFSLMLKNSDVSVLYGADLAGGAIGGVLFGLIIFPLTGFSGIIVLNLLFLSIAYIGGLKNA